MRPTEEADLWLDSAMFILKTVSEHGDQNRNVSSLAVGLIGMAKAMKSLGLGLRATYMKLEEVEAQLKRPQGAGRF